MPRGLILSEVMVKVAIVAKYETKVVPEDVVTAPKQGTKMTIIYTVVDSINQNKAVPMVKRAASVTNSITFRICATGVKNTPSPNPMTNPNLMISHETMTRGHTFHEVQESGQFNDWGGSYRSGYQGSR